MTREFGGVSVQIYRRQNCGARLPGTRVGLPHSRCCGGEIEIILCRQHREPIKLSATEGAQQIGLGPSRPRVRRRVFKRRGQWRGRWPQRVCGAAAQTGARQPTCDNESLHDRQNYHPADGVSHIYL